VASEEELEDYIEEKVPDSVLVFNFAEKPGLDTGRPLAPGETEFDFPEKVLATGLDFSTLDQLSDETNNEDATDVDYIDSFLFSRSTQISAPEFDEPVYEFLEMIGDETPGELIEVDSLPINEDGPIANRDGLFLVSLPSGHDPSEDIDHEFQKLVDSVLL
jgi:hypothetical protein